MSLEGAWAVLRGKRPTLQLLRRQDSTMTQPLWVSDSFQAGAGKGAPHAQGRRAGWDPPGTVPAARDTAGHRRGSSGASAAFFCGLGVTSQSWWTAARSHCQLRGDWAEAHPLAHPGRRSISFLMKRLFMLGQWDMDHTFSSKTPQFPFHSCCLVKVAPKKQHRVRPCILLDSTSAHCRHHLPGETLVEKPWDRGAQVGVPRRDSVLC